LSKRRSGVETVRVLPVTSIVFRYQHQPAMVCCIDVAGEGADLGREFIQRAHRNSV
jgi:hypothetical protein